MNRWKTTFIFLTGFMLHEILAHWWMSLEGLLPFTSRLFNFTISAEMNTGIIAVNIVLLLACVYLGFFYGWPTVEAQERHA